MSLQLKTEWIRWWNSLSKSRRFIPLALASVYWFVLGPIDGLHTDNFGASLLALLLYYSGPRLRPVFQFLMPLFLTIIVYDSMRYYADYIRGPIHVREPYLFDKYFFGIETGVGRLTPNEWWQRHTNPILDFFTGAAYIIFIPVFVLCAAYFHFWITRKGTRRMSALAIRAESSQVMWAFFWVNLLGYSTYYWYAASPPWYSALYGFGPARTDIPANLAGCVRFDQLLGLPIFKNWYGRSADVHGAIPSLHIAYPLQAVLYAFRFGALRWFTLGFYCLMCFSAVYLNHHYVLDVLWGSVYASITVVGIRWFCTRRAQNLKAIPS